ncbi:hypothetical protein MPSEU_000498000 [Mayamaea pseudoterrestris]|nr:hypothetical protein MPSEU_000498000 [Mayamaea pseudoterrestris]
MARLFLVAIATFLTTEFVSSLSTVHFVTGANGYLGRAIVHEIFLSASSSSSAKDTKDRIVCLVRQSRVVSEQAYWNQHLQQAEMKEALSICVRPYDMLDGGEAFETALNEQIQLTSGNESQPTVCLHHVASVFGPTDNHVQTALDNVRGTTDLVEVLAKSAKANENDNYRFVLTSSMAAVRGSGQIPGNEKYYTADDWNTLSQLDESNGWGTSYQWSKTESERQARERCEQHNIPMVSICPSFVFGPPAGASAAGTTSSKTNAKIPESESFAIQLVRQWLTGESPVQSRLFVDVRDVAQAHVAAAQRLQKLENKRWIVSQETRIPSKDIAEWLRSVCQAGGGDFSKIHFDADFQGGAIPIGQREVKAADMLQEQLGVSLRPVKETIVDMAQMLMQDNHSR